MRLILLILMFSLVVKSVPTVPHVPMQTVAPAPVYEVPWWLGGYVATVNETSDWFLPLTYLNGGRTNAGTTLVIQNRGPYNITLHSESPETIQGLSSFLVVAESTVSILSAEDWLVVSSTFGTEGSDGNFDFLQAQNASASCWLAVGTTDPTRKDCGDLTATNSLVVGNVPSGEFVMAVSKILNGTSNAQRGIRSITSLAYTGASANAWGIQSDVDDVYSTGPLGNYVGVSSTLVHSGTNTVVNARGISSSVLIQADSGSVSSNIDAYFGTVTYRNSLAKTLITAYRGIPLSGSGGATVTTYAQFYGSAQSPPTDIILTNSVMFMCPAASNGGINNYCLWAANNDAGPSGGFCAGTAGDVCMWRAAAGAWTFGAGQDLRVPGYLSAGSSAAPTNTNDGAFTTTKATPAVQAFGAVTANAASGVLAFTVTTGAGVCGAAVVTNSNVVAGSEVILTIQKYTGQYITNGTPMVTREDAAGSSVGNFNLNLCNIHATNALSGTLYVAFWVLN